MATISGGKSKTKKGTPPNASALPKKPSTRNRPAKGFNPDTKSWSR